MLTRKAFYRTVLSGFILLIAMTLLFACTPLETSKHGDIDDSGIVMTAEHQTYPADVKEIFITIRNNSGEQASYGVMWELEKLEGSEWKTIPFKPNMAWIEPLYLLDDGAEDMFAVQLDMLDYKLSKGTYRIVKEISGVPVAAEFTVAPKHYELNGTEYSVSLPIYLCTDVYITENTQTHGEGTISLTIDTNRYQVSDCKLILCEDGCSAASVVSRASQGYAVAYNTIANGKFAGNYYTMKFAMEIPEPMVADLVNQGIYEQFAERLAREYYYLLELDKTHYAYICIKPMEDTDRAENEAEIVDDIVKNAEVSFTTVPLADECQMSYTEDTALYNTELYKKASDFLQGEFHRVYDPYYDIQSLTVSDWKENGNEATFLYNMTYIYYNRDPDKVEYIREAKDEDEARYKKMYADYLAPKEMNCEFKIVLNGDEIELYANVSPTGTQWERRNIDDYVLA